MTVAALKSGVSYRLALGLVALVGPLAASSVQAADAVTPPPTQAILNAIATLQAAVNNLQTSSSNVQSSVQTLQSNLPPTWSQTLPAATRFVPALNGEAELDLETGLVWEQAPDRTRLVNWFEAHDTCAGRSKGGREGWRLPTVQELGSLEDMTIGVGALPVGHPFKGVTGAYWSATNAIGAATDAQGAFDTRFAWKVNFDGTSSELFEDKVNNLFVWCVRGGTGVASQ
jgi:hypothetical protein